MIIVRKPNECSKAELNDFASFVCAGGEVNKTGIEERIKKAEALIFISNERCLQGIAAVKKPEYNYKKSVFKKAQATVRTSDFLFELGWVFVLPSSRGVGLSYKLVEAGLVVANGHPVFATSRSDNTAMHKALKAYGFSYHGKKYASSRGDYELILFVSALAQRT